MPGAGGVCCHIASWFRSAASWQDRLYLRYAVLRWLGADQRRSAGTVQASSRIAGATGVCCPGPIHALCLATFRQALRGGRSDRLSGIATPDAAPVSRTIACGRILALEAPDLAGFPARERDCLSSESARGTAGSNRCALGPRHRHLDSRRPFRDYRGGRFPAFCGIGRTVDPATVVGVRQYRHLLRRDQGIRSGAAAGECEIRFRDAFPRSTPSGDDRQCWPDQVQRWCGRLEPSACGRPCHPGRRSGGSGCFAPVRSPRHPYQSGAA
ncbi:hypothetical protein D3C72_1341310 [compost metagenome]